MKITFLGTGTSQGVPVVACNCAVCRSKDPKDKRLRASILIEIDQNTFVIDTGPDFREQMLRENVNKLDAVILTHGHKDHIGGLDDVRAFNFFQRKPMDVYARADVQEAIIREYSYAFAKIRYPGVPQINRHIVENAPFHILGIPFIPIDVLHMDLPVFGYRIHHFTYITDASYISDKEAEKITGSKVLVINALRKREHYSHFNVAQALEIIERTRPSFAYLTHISHQMGLHEDINRELPENVKLAYDGLQLWL